MNKIPVRTYRSYQSFEILRLRINFRRKQTRYTFFSSPPQPCRRPRASRLVGRARRRWWRTGSRWCRGPRSPWRPSRARSDPTRSSRRRKSRRRCRWRSGPLLKVKRINEINNPSNHLNHLLVTVFGHKIPALHHEAGDDPVKVVSLVPAETLDTLGEGQEVGRG